MRYELTHESFVVLEGDDTFFIVARCRLFELDALADQSLDPESHGAWWYGERSDSNLATALSAASGIGPRKESEDAARTSCFVAEVEVVGRRIVEVYSSLDEPKTESSRIEVKIALGVAGDAGDVMDAGSAETHRERLTLL